MKPLTYIVLCILTVHTAIAQPYYRIYCRHITPKNGLSSIYVRKIIQDPYGYMWIGTEDGLNRYDGRNFTIYNRGAAAKHTLCGVDIRDLLLDTLHHLVWTISSFGGIDAIDYITGNSVYSYPQNEDRATANIVFNSLALDGDRLYIGSTDGLFLLRIGSRNLQRAFLHDPAHNVDSVPSIDNVFRDDAGRLWLFGPDQLILLRDSSLTVCTSLDRKSLSAPRGTALHFFDVTLLKDGAVLAATTAGLKTFSCKLNCIPLINNKPYPNIAWSYDHEIYSCRQDKTGSLWFSIAGYLVKANPSGSACSLVREHTSHDELNWLDAVYNICFDKDNNVWLGCQAGLVIAPNRPSAFTCFTTSSQSATSIRHAYSLNPVNDSILYCAAQEGLYSVHIPDGVVTALDLNRPYYEAFIDPYGRMLTANLNGAFIFRSGRPVPISTVYPEFRPLQKLILNSHCYSGDSLIIFGTQNERGVILWNYRRHTARTIDTHTTDLLLPENRVAQVYTDSRGRIWIMGDKSLSILDLATHTIHTLDTRNPHSNKYYSLFFDVCEARGYYYVAAYGSGILVLDSGRHFVRELSVQDGLSANSVYKIIPYKDSLLFVTSNNGMSVVDIPHHYATRNYYESDGLQSDNFEEYSGVNYHNIIYVGGANGFTRIDPLLFTPPAPAPAVYVRRVRIETQDRILDTANLLLSKLKVPEDAQQTTVYFSSIDYQNPDHAHLVYRIKELKTDWIDIGAQDFVPLLGLNPGEYTLALRSVSKDGRRSDHPLELTLQFLPKWFQTLWFKALIILAIAAFFYGLYRYRVYQLQREQQMRKTIAGDLHDDFGSALTTVQIFTHLARREHREEYFSRIEESLDQANTGLRDVIWVLDESEDTIRELANRITKFADAVTRAKGIVFICNLDDAVAGEEISKTAKRNLLLIAKETINNSLKYSGCSRIWVDITESNKRLCICIADDGKGFDTGQRHSGNGLRNIHDRAKQIGFTATITSSEEGTKLEIHGR